MITLIGWVLAAGPASATAPQYRISATVSHLGEVVASPVFIVEEGQTMSVEQRAPDGGNYKLSILVRPHPGKEVSVSLSYSAGKLSAQPNVIVPLGEDYEVTSGKLLIGLRIDPVEAEDA